MPVDPHLETFVRSVWGIAAFFKYLSTMLPLQEIRVECYGSSFWALDAMLSQQGTSEACQQLEQVLLAVPRHSMQFRIVGGGRGSKPLKGNLRNMALKKRFRTLWKKGAIRVELPRSTDTAHAETTAVRGHSRPVKALLVSPDSRWVASAASDGAIILWDARRQVLSREWSAVGKVEHFVSLAFSQDSRCLASAGDHELVVWSIKDGGEVDRLDALQMEGTTIRACSWSPDDAHLAIGCTDATIHILHGRTFQELRVLRFARGARPDAAGRGPGSSVERLSFNNGRWLLSGVERLLFANARWLLSVAPDVSHGCRLWDIAAGKLRTVLRGHTASITTASFNPTGTRLATASMDHTVRIWDIDRAAPLAVLRGHTGPVLDVAFSPDGKFVLSASEDRTAKVWPASGGRCTHSFKHFNWVYAVRFSSDGRYIATASWDHTVRLFRASDGALVKRLWEHAGAHVRHLAFSPDGETLWSGADDGSVSGRRLSNIIDA
ncbi:quinon protein alcohol dehydrogenase-like superfamily [Dichomitus squalens]|nr:quinon protein alcohol dehydrogenase-like superfamily [Dichomitus squalens]